MKIGIVTYSSAHNYGAVLQAWALQKYLEIQGHEVNIINYRPWIIDDVYAMAKKRKISKNKHLNILLNKGRIVKNSVKDLDKYKRYRKFEKFIAKDLNTTNTYRKYTQIRSALELEYDVLIAGSDQIWNSDISKRINPVYFLAFGKKETKRISYAASIGGESLPEEEEYIFRTFLRDFDYISVREVNAKESVQKYTTKPVELVADPTFLIGQKEFDEIKKEFKVEGDYIYVHNVHLVRVDAALNAVAEELSCRTGLPIVHNRKEKFFSKEGRKFLSGSPGEFIGVISKASYVVTNSFHATVFAIIYHSNFITVPHFKNPDRMRYLLSTLNLANHLIGRPEDLPETLSELQIDYENMEQKKQKMGDISREFLQKALKGPKTSNQGKYHKDKDVMKCYGCRGCSQKGIETSDGFWYPEYSETSGEHCGDVCIYHNENTLNKKSNQNAYLLYTSEKNIIREDTLLDLITPFARKIFSMQGKLAGVMLPQNGIMKYDLIEEEEKLVNFSVEEVFEAETGDIYKRIEDELKRGIPVLFCGSACKIARLRIFLGKEYEKLYTIQIMNQGLGSPEVLKKYCDKMEELYQSPIVQIEFRNKFRKANEDFLVIKFKSGSIKVEDTRDSYLMKILKQGKAQRPACYTCELRAETRGTADIEIGKKRDYQISISQMGQIEREESILKTYTEKGESLWDTVKEAYINEEIDTESIKTRKIFMTYARNRFLEELEAGENILEVLKKYSGKTRRRR